MLLVGLVKHTVQLERCFGALSVYVQVQFYAAGYYRSKVFNFIIIRKRQLKTKKKFSTDLNSSGLKGAVSQDFDLYFFH